MLVITPDLSLPLEELEFTAIRAQGAGGQHVNKTSSAVQLRLDVPRCSLPEDCRERLLHLAGQKATREGVVIIKAQRFRSQEQNRADAIARLLRLLVAASEVPVERRATKPSRAAKRKRVDEKTQRGQVKQLRGKPVGD